MAQPFRPAFLALPDPLVESEGSVDPLALQRTYERLADAAFPAVTVRMGRIRFVTAMCLGALVCRDFDDDAVAIDGKTPPWLVFEWFVVEAFARLDKDTTRGARIPGLQKAQHCLHHRRPLGAATYLKTPKVFGFHGIFRRLATQSHILDDDLRLGTGGEQLLRALEKQAKLPGLLRDELRVAVERGLERGSTVPQTTTLWDRLASLLSPDAVGNAEAKLLIDWLKTSSPLTAEYVDALILNNKRLHRADEPGFMANLARTCSTALANHLHTIAADEALCRPLVAAFDVVRNLATARHLASVGAADFAALENAREIVDAVRAGCIAVEEDPHLLDREPDVRHLLDRFRTSRSPEDLFHALAEHHEAAQRAKPPDGKRSWFERASNDTIVLRPAYALPALDAPLPFAHDYRTATMTNFISDTLGIS